MHSRAYTRSRRYCRSRKSLPFTALAAIAISSTAPAAMPDVAGGISQCQPVAGQGQVTQWNQLVGESVVNSLQYGNRVVDVTSFASLFDYPGTAPDNWPGSYDLYSGIALPSNRYLSAAFTVRAGLDLSALQGFYSVDNRGFSVPVSMTISFTCGDFGQINPTSVVQNCSVNAAGAGDSLAWQGAADAQACVLQPGYEYYLNVINADISQLPSTGVAVSTANASCNPAGCFDPIVNGPGNWGVADDIFYSPFE